MAHTPWGELRVHDAHTHYFTHEFYSVLARQRQLPDATALGPLLRWEIPPPEPEALAQRWIDELDVHGVYRASLIASLPGQEETVAHAVSLFPDRFYGYFMLDPLQPDAVERMNRAGVNPHLHAVCLFPAMHRYSIADARISPILEAAAVHRLAVFVHCGALSIGVRQKLGLPSLFDMRYSNPLEIHPVAHRFPQVQFIVPHFGAGLLREALLLADLCPNVWFDTSSSNRWMRYEGLDLDIVFRRSLDVMGPSRLLFGTDSGYFPRGWHRSILTQQAATLDDLGLSADDAQLIFSGNLDRLFMARKSMPPGLHS